MKPRGRIAANDFGERGRPVKKIAKAWVLAISKGSTRRRASGEPAEIKQTGLVESDDDRTSFAGKIAGEIAHHAGRHGRRTEARRDDPLASPYASRAGPLEGHREDACHDFCRGLPVAAIPQPCRSASCDANSCPARIGLCGFLRRAKTRTCPSARGCSTGLLRAGGQAPCRAQRSTQMRRTP